MTIFFYDSYAVIEYINNNPNFRSYFEEHTGILAMPNIMEIYYSVLNEMGKEEADEVIETLWTIVVEPTKETIKNAMVFRQKMKRKNISYADSLGYQMAQERGIKFLTGDSQFKDMEGTEFVK